LIALRGPVEEIPMPWNDSHFPPSMLHLAPPVRGKAIEIANALLAQGYDEGRAIRIGISQAKHWASRIASEPRAL
jgi:uncharacterized protein YdaT